MKRGLLGAAALLALAGLALAAGARLDPRPVSEAEFAAFLKERGAGDPRPSSPGPAVNLTWHQARAFCRARGKRLPSAEEWLAACRAKRMTFPWWIWEWTTTDAEAGARGPEGAFKVLCGPGAECSCTHAYRPDWRNEVKGFRCARPEPSVRLGGRP